MPRIYILTPMDVSITAPGDHRQLDRRRHPFQQSSTIQHPVDASETDVHAQVDLPRILNAGGVHEKR
jgi:hypothetical protein